MQTRTPLTAAALLVAGALLDWLAASVRLATTEQAENKQAASAELDRIVRLLFALVNQHMRREFNDLARRLDEQPAAADLCEELVPSPLSSGCGLTPDGLRMLEAIDALPRNQMTPGGRNGL
jgi:hypothetical protein